MLQFMSCRVLFDCSIWRCMWWLGEGGQMANK